MSEITIECDLCDGCGWYEGGESIKTTCEKCNGTGMVAALHWADQINVAFKGNEDIITLQAATIKAQRERIERLSMNIEKLKQERDAAYERAAQVCDEFAIPSEGNVFEVTSWNVVSDAIRALKAEPKD